MVKIFQYAIFLSQIFAQDIGFKMYQNNDFDSAINYYKKLLENKQLNNFKDHIEFNLATILTQIDSLDSAKKYFEEAILDSTHSNSNLYYNYAHNLYSSNDLSNSLDNFKKAVIKDPSNMQARMNYEFVKKQINQSNPPAPGSKNEDPKTDNQDKNEEERPSNRPDNNSKNEKKEDQTNSSQDDSSNKPQDTNNNQNNEFQSSQNSENLLNALKEKEKVNKKRKLNTYPEGSLKSW